MAVKTAGAKNLQNQLDEAFPQRKRPDGWIADARHGISGHQPDDVPNSKATWNGDPDNIAEVRALDVSADLGPGVDSHDVVDHLCGLARLSTVIRFIIHDRKIYHARTGFEAEDYDGDNPHDKHIHVEFAWTQSADNNNTFDYRLQEVPVALTAADKAWLSAEIKKQVAATAGPAVWNHTEPDPVNPRARRRTGGDMRSIEHRAAKRHAEVLAAIKAAD